MSKHARFHQDHSAPSLKRWLLLLAASVFFHWAALQWMSGNLSFPLQSQPPESVVTAQLRYASIAKPAPKATEAPQKTAQPRAKPKIASVKKEKPLPALPEEAATPVAMHESIEPEQEDLLAADPGTGAEAVASPAEDSDNTQEESAASLALDLPPSAELKYDVQAQKKGLPYYGTGIINWQANGNQYVITGKAKAAFFTVLEFKSEGEVDSSGIAPVLYAERAGNRSETNTHFHRERDTISFSASSMSYPRVGGEQDRASIIWQLAALGRSSPDLFRPGEELTIFVAGVRNAAPWRIFILEEEEIVLDGGPVKTWHIKSVPLQGGYEKTFDIWFASGYEWYPVKLRQTEVSGDYLELTLSNLVLAQQ